MNQNKENPKRSQKYKYALAEKGLRTVPENHETGSVLDYVFSGIYKVGESYKKHKKKAMERPLEIFEKDLQQQFEEANKKKTL
jgi:hypothetical protein